MQAIEPKRVKVTARIVESLTPRKKPYNVVYSELRGFLVRIQTSGVKSYYARYRVQGRQTQMKIADATVKTPSEARDKAKEAMGEAVDGKDPATVSRDLATLRTAFSWALDQGLIKANPMAKIKPLKLDKSPKVRCLNEQEERRFLDALDTREERIRSGRDSFELWRREWAQRRVRRGVRGKDWRTGFQGVSEATSWKNRARVKPVSHLLQIGQLHVIISFVWG